MQRKTIMVADDDQDILDLLTILLIKNGYHVRTAFNGNELDTLEHDLPDLLLLDIRMSGRNGQEICYQLKQKETTKNLPILLISANHDLAEAAQASGANGYVSKPIDLQNLLSTIRLHL